MKEIIRNIWLNVKNIPGWKTSRKIIVIEADDYGSLRMPSNEVYEQLLDKGYISSGVHDKYDSIETVEDLSELFKVLKSVRDSEGNYAKITPFFNPTNPDTASIIENNYNSYEYIDYRQVVKEQKIGNSIFDLWEEGIDLGIFKPQYHGREHVNVPKLMELLQSNHQIIRESFEMGFYHPILNEHKEYHNLRRAFYFDNEVEKNIIKNGLVEGYDVFNRIFNYNPIVFSPSNGTFHPDFKKAITSKGIKTFVESGVRYIPRGNGKIDSERKFVIGRVARQENTINYSRNVTFEPSDNKNAVKKALDEIEVAFRWNKPAVIATHRTNFSGKLDKVNRERSLEELKTLLINIKSKWPDVLFLNSEELSKMMHADLFKSI